MDNAERRKIELQIRDAVRTGDTEYAEELKQHLKNSTSSNQHMERLKDIVNHPKGKSNGRFTTKY